jgi:phenylacetate-CoA ligase
MQREVYHAYCLDTLATALDHTPMYRSWQRLDPGVRQSVDRRYGALPALTKADLRAHFPDGVVPHGLDLADALARGEVSFVATSGSADDALTNIWNQEWWNTSERASWQLNAVAARAATGTHREAILASALSVGPRSDGPPLDQAQRTLDRFLFLNEFGSPALWPPGHEQRMLDELAAFQPAVLEANPSLLARLARFAARSGRVAFQPQLIVLTYEFVSRLQLRAIRQVFRSPLASSYGSTESGYVFMECEHGRLHQNSASCRVDVQPLCDGVSAPQVGRALVTTFGNRWFPLLRFDIGDLVRLASEPCPCGRDFGLTLASIEGRLVSTLRTPDERLLTHRQIDDELAPIEDIVTYQLRQTAPEQVDLALVPERDRPPAARRAAVRAAAEALRDLLGSAVAVDVRIVADLQPEPSGKFLLVKRQFALPIDHYLCPGKELHA